jgi:preprotein translocase subunit SecF
MSTLGRLYRGETNIDFIGHRKRWYIASAIMLLVCVLSIVFRQFNYGIEFAGGNSFQVPVKPGISLQEVRGAVESAGVEVSSAQVAGNADTRQYLIKTAELSDDQRTEALKAVSKTVGVPVNDINTNEVSSSWGQSVTEKALIALAVFLLVVGAFIWLLFEQKMAIAALAALAHDLLLTAGIYSLIGFEVTPGTIIGLLTILGYSLYDTVVVFDKVAENTRGLLGSSRYTYGEAANVAVNQTLMRSINTSIIGLLPVAGLLFVGAGLLGAGTLKDLALVLFVGMLTGAYSSLFLATPWLVDLKLMDSRYKLHAQRVLAKRAAAAKAGDSGADKAARTRVKAGAKAGADDAAADDSAAAGAQPRVDALASSSAPRPGARPAQTRKRSSGKRR